MDKTKKNKILSIVWSFVFMAAVAAIVMSFISLFNNFYYESIYVSGSSMAPTLSGNLADCDYGIIDKSDGAKRSLKRFQIVTTYYPHDTSSYKIKRVIALPGDTFKVVNNDLYLYKDNEWNVIKDIPYERTLDEYHIRNYPETTLKEDQYFVSGDNYTGSTDSFTVGPLTYDLLQGVVVKIQGRCTVDAQGNVIERRPSEPRYFLGVDY